MATSVKMDDDTKARLERLQAEIRLQTGTRVTQQELLARLVEEAIESKADLVDSFREERVPLADAEREAFHEGMVSSGVTTSEEDIDDVLYG
jgi:predicted transcriptional regulator